MNRKNILALIFLLIGSSCNDLSQLDSPNITGVWKKVIRIDGLKAFKSDTIDYLANSKEFMIINNSKMIQKYIKNCYCEVWTYDYTQDGIVLLKTIANSHCQNKYIINFDRDTLILSADDIIQKWILCDSITEPNWKNPNWYTDMQILAPSFCIMTERYGSWTDPINEQQLFNFEESARSVIADTLDFVARNKFICDSNSFFSLNPIIPHNEPVDSFYWYFNGIVASNEMYPSIRFSKKGFVDVELCVKYKTGLRACMTKLSYLQVL